MLQSSSWSQGGDHLRIVAVGFRGALTDGGQRPGSCRVHLSCVCDFLLFDHPFMNTAKWLLRSVQYTTRFTTCIFQQSEDAVGDSPTWPAEIPFSTLPITRVERSFPSRGTCVDWFGSPLNSSRADSLVPPTTRHMRRSGISRAYMASWACVKLAAASPGSAGKGQNWLK